MAQKSKSAKKKTVKPKSQKAKPAKKDKASAELDAAKATIKKLRSTVDRLEANVAKLEKKAAGLKAAAKKATRAKPAPPVQAVKPAGAPTTTDTRTVAQLRAEAKAKGVAGYSRMRKEQLLAAL